MAFADKTQKCTTFVDKIQNCAVVWDFHAIGGNYQYQHATVTHFPSQLGGQEPAAVFADHIIVNEETLQDLLSVNITHSIIWGGSAESDLFLSLRDAQGQDINITNNLIFSNQEWNQNLTSDALEYVRFKDPFIFDYRLDSMSPAINGSIGSGLLIDLLGKRRDSIPDLGAYEYFNNWTTTGRSLRCDLLQ